MKAKVDFHKPEPTEKELYAQAGKMAKKALTKKVDRVEMIYWDDFSEATIDIAADYSAVVTFGAEAKLVPEGMDPIECAPEDFEEEHYSFTVSMERDDNDGRWRGTVDIQEN